MADEPQGIYASEYKLMKVRDIPLDKPEMTEPEEFYKHWLKTVPTAPWYQTEKECLVVFFLNTRCHFTGLHLVSLGILDTAISHPREIFRPAIVHAAHSIIVSHNHPSGDPTPSEADIKVTRDLVRAGQLLQIDVKDHIIVGEFHPSRPKPYYSLRNAGYFY